MTTAQVLFSVALGAITLIIVAFAVFVASTTLWSDRWVSKKTATVDSDRKSEDG